jgi:hypothetical protein
MKYSQEQQNQILSKINAGVVGTRKEWVWDRITIRTIWDKDKVINETKKYTLYDDFCEKSNGAYNYAKKYGFLEEVTSDLIKKTFWNVDNASKVAKLYKTKGMFAKSKDKGGYRFLKKNNLLDIYFPKKHVNEVSKEAHYEVAKTCKTRSEFNSKKGSYYQKSLKKGWLDEWFPKK